MIQNVLLAAFLLSSKSVHARIGRRDNDNVHNCGINNDNFCKIEADLFSSKSRISIGGNQSGESYAHRIHDGDYLTYQVDFGPGVSIVGAEIRYSRDKDATAGGEIQVYIVDSCDSRSNIFSSDTMIASVRPSHTGSFSEFQSSDMDTTKVYSTIDGGMKCVKVVAKIDSANDNEKKKIINRFDYIIFSILHSDQPVDYSQNQMGCINALAHDPDTNFFPQQVTPLASEKWNVRYESSYKVVTNIQEGSTYILYQCGTEPPTIENESAVHGAKIISVPIAGAGVSQTPQISYMEILNLRNKISVYYGDTSLVSSPCLLKMMGMSGDENTAEPMVPSVPDTDNATAMTELLTEEQRNLTIFVGSSYNAPDNSVIISEWSENTLAGTFEWIKYYSLFFNEEENANEVYDEVTDRYKCIEENAQLQAESNSAEPKVLWAYYNHYCGGWEVASCPNYYCEFAESCSSEILHSPPDASITNGPCGTFGSYLTLEEIFEFGKDADHWIYPSADWDTIYEANKEQLDEMKAVQNNQVFDYQGSGEKAWFEQRMVEYENVLEDFCEVVGTIKNRDRVWFRNVFEDTIGDLGSCADPTAPYKPFVTECVVN